MERLGQHFLKNKSAIGKIIAALDLKTGDNLVEIGSGKGALTLPLLEKIKDLSGKLMAIEKDEALAKELSRAVDKMGNTVNIVVGDALKELPRMGRKNKWKLVGNIPYYITGHLLRIIGELEKKPEITVLMIQKEVAERVTANPGKMNLLAAATQIWADISIVATLKPEDFDPPPEVESAIIKVVLRPAQELNILSAEQNRSDTLASYYKFIKIAFKQPRKTLLNNLKVVLRPAQELNILSAEQSRSDTEKILNVLRQNGYDEKTRAQDLSVEKILSLSRLF